MKFQISEELELRPFAEENAEELFETVTANYEHLRQFLDWATEDYSLESAKEFIERSQKASAENTSQGFGIFYRGKIVGAIGFVSFDRKGRRTEIGYWISKDYESKGIITKSCQKLIDYAFDKLGMNRIEIRCATENTRSRAIPERLNFKLEGVSRQSTWRNGRFYDTAIYGILAEERENI